MDIPFNKPYTSGKELEYIQQATEGYHLAGDGAFTKKCQEILEEQTGAAKALLTTSCTHALEMSALLLDVQPGDEVIVPAFTFVSSINAFVLRGAMPVFCDVRPDTLNLDEALLENLVTEKTKAIVVVHYGGVACEMDSILAIAEKHNVLVVEDNAQGLFGKYHGRPLGSLGTFACQSFHETKNIQCGEGGALLINDEDFIERAEIIREKGTNRSRFFRGQVDKYTWVDVGSSYLPSDMLAAYLAAQLEQAKKIQAKRQQIWESYFDGLANWAADNDVTLPTVPNHCEQSYHLFYVLMPSLQHRQKMINHLKTAGIHSVFHYQPLNLSEMGIKFGGHQGQCKVTESAADRLLRLPFYYELEREDIEHVVQSVKRFEFS